MGLPDLYQELGVDRYASTAQVKEAYEAAKSKVDASKEPLKLEQLKEAHEILSSDARRSEYDANYSPSDSKQQTSKQSPDQPSGKQGSSIDTGNIKQQAKDALNRAQDPNTPAIETVPDNILGKVADLMSETLGNGKLFEDYVGQVAIAAGMLAAHASSNDAAAENLKQEKLQAERESALAGILRAKLQPFVEGDESSFREKAVEDAHELALLPCGTAMLHAIGWSYEHAAKPKLDSSLKEWVVRKGHKLATNAAAISAKASAVAMYIDFKHFGKHGAMNVAEASKFVEDRIGWVITNLWNLLIKDLEDTLRHVTRLVLEEEGTAKDVVQKRAHGLAVLAEIFQGAKRDKDGFELTLGGGEGVDVKAGVRKLQAGAQQLLGQAGADGPADGGNGSDLQGKAQGALDQAQQQGQEAAGQARQKAQEGVQQAKGAAQQQVREKVPRPEEAGGKVQEAGEKQAKPAARSLANTAPPAAEKLAEEQIKPGAKAVAENADKYADEATEGYIKPTADTIAKEAEPRAKEFTEGQLKPAAEQASKQAKPTAEQIKSQGINPAADAVKKNAQPLADKAIKEGVQPIAKDVSKNAEPLADQIVKEVIQPVAQAVNEKAVPVTQKITEEDFKPLVRDNAQQLEGAADRLTQQHLQPGAQQLAEQLEPAAQDFTQNQLKPKAAAFFQQLQAQAEQIAEEGPEIAEKLPKALKRACEIDRIPKDLQGDVVVIAEWLQKLVPKVKEAAAQLPEKAELAQQRLEPAVDRAANVIEQQAHEAAAKLPAAADKASDQIQGTAKELANNAEPTADKLSKAAVQSAERAAEIAIPTGDKASVVLKRGAKGAAENADEYGKRAADTVQLAADEATKNADRVAKEASERLDAVADRVEKEAPARADEASNRINKQASEIARKAPEAADEASANIKQGAKSVKEGAPKAGDQASQALKQGADAVSRNAEPAADEATRAAADQSSGASDFVHKFNEGKMSTDEAADKLSQGIANAPDKVADLVDKLAGAGKQAADSASSTAQKGRGDAGKKA